MYVPVWSIMFLFVSYRVWMERKKSYLLVLWINYLYKSMEKGKDKELKTKFNSKRHKTRSHN